MELRQVSTAVKRTLDKRYQIVYQPVVIDIPIKPLTRGLCSQENDLASLYRWLDWYAQAMIAKALENSPLVETNVSPLNFLGHPNI